MPHSVNVLDTEDIPRLKYIITHVFCPLQLPDGDDYGTHNDHSLAKAIITTARLYGDYVGQANLPQWHSISRMLENLLVTTSSESLDRSKTISQFGSMRAGDILALRIRAQNAGVIFRKQKDVTIFEAFELSPMAKDVMSAEGKLICSYPGPAIEIPNRVFDDNDFRSELVNFLYHMNHDVLPPVDRTSQKFQDTVHPRYITKLLTGILRGVGCPADICRISKRVGDDVVCSNSESKLPWRRSSLWLFIRVTLQTTLDRSPQGQNTYKGFMLFFMCRIAKEKTCTVLSNDLLHFMSTKISRRLRKLGSSAPNWLSRAVLEACISLRSTIEDRWKQVQAAQRLSPLWAPSQLDLTQDTQLSLLHCGDYLGHSLSSHSINLPHIHFNPEHRARGALDDFLCSKGIFFKNAYHSEPHVALYDVEWAVEQGIDTWVDGVTNNDKACVKLEILADSYSKSALKTYANNPEFLSIMLLTTIELWVALDKIAIKEIPMLADYSPEVPVALLENLLLCKTASLDRLRIAHEYLSRRHSQSRTGWSVFSSTTSTNSFAVRFYRQSPHLRRIKIEIQKAAPGRIRQAAGAPMGLTLSKLFLVYRLEAKVVFELNCPVSFNMWRTATFHLLVDLCSPSIQQSDISRTTLDEYYGLRHLNYLRSSTGPHINTHSISTKDKTIPISEVFARSDSQGYCTYKLPSGPYHNLQKYVDSTSHNSNDVMTNQGDCHKGFFIHEYIAFGHLRSGSSLQWLNILRELRSQSLTFRRQEVYMLLAQAVSQVGPLVNSQWTWHQEIQQPTFCYALLGELRSVVRDIEASWLQAVTMDTISLLLRRLLASSPDEAVSLEALGLLRTVRGKVFSWVQELSDVVIKPPRDEELRGVLRDAAAICLSTFDVDFVTIPTLVHLHSTEDIDILLSSTMIIHDLMPSDVSSLTIYSQLLLDRAHRLSLALESIISNIIQTDSSDRGINLAIGRIWPGYRPGSKWTALEPPNSRWFSCETARQAHQRPQMVHFNILNGSLFVDGKPLGSWMPNDFMRHPLYKLLFGENILEVIQANLPGMDYCTRGTISDHQVYFSLGNDSSDLVIRVKPNRADAGDSEIIELIPHEKLKGDFPAVLIEGHVHWLNLSTSIMEIRPFDSLWKTSSEHWRVDCTPGRYRMWKGREVLVDTRSQSWNMVSSLLRPLSSPKDLIISVSPVSSSQPTSSLQLSVLLPRYGLSFFVDEDGDLQSQNFQGMVYDENQSIGTLFGLVNQLALRPKIKHDDATALIPRCVLIPDGEISFQVKGHHVRVKIATDRSVLKRITYQTYRVDTDLGCLAGDDSLTSKLYCAYLHSLSSGCTVDPLTGRSGTEEALSILQSASCWLAVRFSSRDADLLALIASISASRTWCLEGPMQKVRWRNLPVNSQHPGLYIHARAIKEHCERHQTFHQNQPSVSFQKFPSRDDRLLKRSARRAVYLYPFDSAGQPSGGYSEIRYHARDVVEVASGEHRAYTVAACVHHRTATSKKDMDIWNMVEPWKNVIGDTICQWSLQYSRSWLAPDLSSIWLKTYNLLRQDDERKWFQLIFSLPAMVYASPKLGKLVPVFVCFASCTQFRLEHPPHYDSYPLSTGCYPSSTHLKNHVLECAYPFHRSPEHLERAKFGETSSRLEMYESRLRSDARATLKMLLAAWPTQTCPPLSLSPDLYDVTRLTSQIQKDFSSCFRNLQLIKHLTRVQTILNEPNPDASPAPTPDNLPYTFYPSRSILACTPPLKIDELFARPPPPLRAPDRLRLYLAEVGNTSPTDFTPLYQLISAVEANAIGSFQHQYVSALRASAGSLERETSLVAHAGGTKVCTARTLLKHHTRCRTSYIEALDHLVRHLGPRSQSEQAFERSGQWPRITARTFFWCLASNSPIALPDDWKKCIIGFTLLALALQRARRLLLLYFDNLHEELRKELQNEEYDGWDPEAHPDWLLIQLQGNCLIRNVQAEVANEMISPRSDGNITMQLNMGEGKSSIIVPLVVAVLANGNQLVRVIVPKPLIPQTLHLLTNRLSGLTNRRIYHLQFSRSLEVNVQQVATLRQIMLECMEERGILVVQPEDVMSLKLLSLEKQLSQTGDRSVAHMLLELQQWLHSRSRDILDESDEILDVRSQLVFTIGDQQHLEGSPERWTTIEQVLGIVSKHASSLQELFPFSVEYVPGPPGSFPYLRILQGEAGKKLISWIVEDVIDGHLPNIAFERLYLHSELRDAIRNFISCEDVCPAKVRLVKESTGRTLLWHGLLLLRGLLANGILLNAFRERRWRVNYGLAQKRTMLAVPYRAKDVPAPRAEFGHPDVAIILTCLSYYYSGLSEEKLKLAFQILLSQRDPSSDYDLWVRACPIVPESLRAITGVNMRSLEQWNGSLVPIFSRNRATIDFYLSNVVFPTEAKEFTSKLASSGWDLAEKKERLLTGFSGTNDAQYLLPLHIAQHNPDHQRGTNAKVLSYLLQPENKHYMCMAKKNGKQNIHEFLRILVTQEPEIRVLLDVGAQVLDLHNYQLAVAWLDISPNASAAIYFDDDDELMVCTRDGSAQLLRSSPFSQQLDRCVIYIDDAHTRGTDINFPNGFRAAVTLGPKVNKDRLVQGCMRMRKLGYSHSIIFFAPLDVDQQIRSLTGKDKVPLDPVDTMDILQWAIQETWVNIQRWAPHWVQQGMDHTSRYGAWIRFRDGQLASTDLAREWMQPEAKGLEELYEPRNLSNLALLTSSDIRQRGIDLGVLSLSSVGIDEEQERELVHEVRRERQAEVERPSRIQPASHTIHPDVVHFVKTGVIPPRNRYLREGTKAFRPAFETLHSTSAVVNETYIWSQSLLVTTDFERTAQEDLGKMDNYLRPVHWIVSAKRDTGNHVLVIFSPYEVNALLPDIRSSKKVHLHQYTPRIIKSMKPCDDLSLYSIPAVPKGWTFPSFMDELSVFSGQLYLKNYETYVRLCRFLCVYTRELQGEEGFKVEPDGFILPENRRKIVGTPIGHTFASTPMVTLKALMHLRSKDIDFTSTHMGKLVHGHLLSESDFDD